MLFGNNDTKGKQAKATDEIMSKSLENTSRAENTKK